LAFYPYCFNEKLEARYFIKRRGWFSLEPSPQHVASGRRNQSRRVSEGETQETRSRDQEKQSNRGRVGVGAVSLEETRSQRGGKQSNQGGSWGRTLIP
jgi:transglutaminase-like putative cysteine protease